MSDRKPYESQLRAARARETRERLLDAVALLARSERAATISMTEVAERAGVSLRTVYVHFPDKEALFAAAAERRAGLVARVAADEVPDLAPPSRRRLAALLHAVSSPEAVLLLRSVHGLDEREANDAVAWALEALVAHARDVAP